MPTRSRRIQLILFAVSFYLLAVGYVLHGILRATGGHFVYALDDPYIHLALAEKLAHGHYGINPSEFTSPASSVLWPFLLVPFAGTSVHLFVPLAWNLLFGCAAACLIASFISNWPPRSTSGGNPRQSMPWWQQAVTAVLVLFAANLPSLTFLGMEHVLQVLVTIACAYGMANVFSGLSMPVWCIAAAVLAPSVRYEDLSLTLAVSLALFGVGRWKSAAAVFGGSLAPLIAFSVFLKGKGLPLLPLSVLVKGDAFAGSSALSRAMQLVRGNIHLDVIDPTRYPVDILFFIFLGLACRPEAKERRFVYIGAAVLGALQLLIGRFGWFHRYEVYAVIFLSLLLLRVLAERPPFLFGFYVLGLLSCASPYIAATLQTASAAGEVYAQQYQMHRFVSGFYQGDYAVNDLGMVSFNRAKGAYVLDVFGLASLEASKQTTKSAPWLQGIVQRHNIGLAILYPEWFHIPDSWSAIAGLCVDDRETLVLGEPCAVFYSTQPQSRPLLEQDLKRFAATMPGGTYLYLAPVGSDYKWLPPRKPSNQ